jgi:hypothetical protein
MAKINDVKTNRRKGVSDKIICERFRVIEFKLNVKANTKTITSGNLKNF